MQKKCARHVESSKLMLEWLQHVLHCRNNILLHSANRSRSSFHIKSELFVIVEKVFELAKEVWIQQFFQMPGIFFLAVSDLRKWQGSHQVYAREKNLLPFFPTDSFLAFLASRTHISVLQLICTVLWPVNRSERMELVSATRLLVSRVQHHTLPSIPFTHLLYTGAYTNHAPWE